ncbi:CDP-glycerol glycerophosphotransferase family protein [Streptomyces sp. NBC_01237]|uniref:CDP-glycerol glycerophosphotransferase family protein n=1 Tax=Streptomyces sp. NBC_01237 TaxID=2903790 RepID=UPI002DD8C6F7|nr:CDP-glycerol glycerophosphotransferase family protein [Streptomyces sp. NBC_01237]WRZ72344.1 CDP-glycerol glycerophosphotransferase family protein [Streptomyces sp. NBC_01237]
MASLEAIPEELSRLMKYFPETPVEERPAFHSAAKEFLAQAAPKLVRKFSPMARVKWHLAASGRGDELEGLLHYERENPGAFSVRGLRRARIELPGVENSSLPPTVRNFNRSELPVRGKLLDLTWKDGRLVVHGYAYIPNVPSATGKRSLRVAVLRRQGSRSTLPLRVRTVQEPRATAEAKGALHNYDWSGFEIGIDPARLRTRGQWQPGTWRLGVGIPRPGGMSVGSVTKNNAGAAGHSQVHVLDDGVRLVAGFDRNRLKLTVDIVPAEVEAQEADADTLSVTLRSRATGKKPTALRIDHEASGYATDLPLVKGDTGADGWVRHTARLSFADLPVDGVTPGRARKYRALIVFEDGTTRRATIGQKPATGVHPLPGGLEFAVLTDGAGNFTPQLRSVQPVVDSVEWSAGGELVLSGTYTGPAETMKLILRHTGRNEDRPLPAEFEDGRFTARVTPDSMPAYEGTLPLRAGRWLPFLRARAEWDHTRDIPVTIRPDLVDTLPLTHRGAHRTYTVERLDFDRIFVESGPVLDPELRGAYRQRLMRDVYTPEQRALPLREAVLYNSFGGKQFSDSPRAVYEELVRRGTEVEHIAMVHDQQVVLPPGVRGVEWGSKEWYEALARSRYVVTNGGIREWFVRREGQVVVQTWHGTPLKRIGADLLGTPKANLAYIASLPQRSRQYSLFITPNSFTTPIMTNSFRLECEVLEAGYPRNDVFHAPDRVKRASAVREKLGIPAGKKVVLYAPTWRDDQRYGGRRFKLDNQIDVDAAQRELGDDHVLLYRKHHKVLDSIPGAGQGFVWDVTYYPDIADLYLIADVLITDYSSVLFDFAHSGRPMLFFTYDLEHYRDTLRGFYFDFTSRAPGPLIKTSEDLVSAIRNIGAVTEEYKEKYAQFRVDFCEPSDGRAAARVVDRMLTVNDG